MKIRGVKRPFALNFRIENSSYPNERIFHVEYVPSSRNYTVTVHENGGPQIPISLQDFIDFVTANASNYIFVEPDSVYDVLHFDDDPIWGEKIWKGRTKVSNGPFSID